MAGNPHEHLADMLSRGEPLFRLPQVNNLPARYHEVAGVMRTLNLDGLTDYASAFAFAMKGIGRNKHISNQALSVFIQDIWDRPSFVYERTHMPQTLDEFIPIVVLNYPMININENLVQRGDRRERLRLLKTYSAGEGFLEAIAFDDAMKLPVSPDATQMEKDRKFVYDEFKRLGGILVKAGHREESQASALGRITSGFGTSTVFAWNTLDALPDVYQNTLGVVPTETDLREILVRPLINTLAMAEQDYIANVLKNLTGANSNDQIAAAQFKPEDFTIIEKKAKTGKSSKYLVFTEKKLAELESIFAQSSELFDLLRVLCDPKGDDIGDFELIRTGCPAMYTTAVSEQFAWIEKMHESFHLPLVLAGLRNSPKN